MSSVSVSVATVQCSGVSVWHCGWSLPQVHDGENPEADLPRYIEVSEHEDEAGDREETTGTRLTFGN